MKINVENTEKVQAELDRVQRKAYAGIYDAASVAADAVEAERRMDRMLLTETEKRGAVWEGYARAAGGKTWREDSSTITLERGTGGRWFLTHVARYGVHEGVRSSVRTVNATPGAVLYRLARAEGVALA